MQDVCVVDCGYLLGNSLSRCFQLAVLHCFEGGMRAVRSELCARLRLSCGNDVGSSFAGDGLARRNLGETQCALRELRLGVWVVFARDASVLKRGCAVGKLYMGCPDARTVGCVAWFKQGHAVALQGGSAVRGLLRFLPSIDCCPGSYGAVCGPKKRTPGSWDSEEARKAVCRRWEAVRVAKKVPGEPIAEVRSSRSCVSQPIEQQGQAIRIRFFEFLWSSQRALP